MHVQLNRTMCSALRDYNSWPHLLPFLQCIYNSTYSTVLKCTPDFLHRGRNVNCYTSALLTIPEQVYCTHGELAGQIASNLQKAFVVCNENLGRAAEMSKCYYNRLKRVPDFSVGDRVLVFLSESAAKSPDKMAPSLQAPLSYYSETVVSSLFCGSI